MAAREIKPMPLLEYFSGATSATHTMTEKILGFMLSNDGSEPIVCTIVITGRSSLVFTVLPREVFDDVVGQVVSVALAPVTGGNPIAYRLWARGYLVC